MVKTVLEPIDRRGVPQLARSMAKAFFTDPLMTYIVPEDDRRRVVGEWFFAKAIGYCQKWGEVHADASLSGGAAWLPPGNTSMSTIRIMRAGFWQAPFRLGVGGFSRFNKVDEATRMVHKKAVPGDHWYLLLLGVDPDRQKSGIGSAAIEMGVAKAAVKKLPIYLETMTESNVAYYSKRGFTVAEEFVIDGEVRTWAMVRTT